jgi:L-threonylcarbamoyladenylate synthase
MAIIGVDIARAAALLTSGSAVAIPTETVYGLAANALDGAAVAKIFEIKNRPSFDPLIVHVADIVEAMKYATHFPPLAQRLAEQFWPGPLTLVLPKGSTIPDIVSSGLATVGIRVPSHPLARALLHAVEFPLAAPSANPFGYVSPTSAAHVQAQLGSKLSYIIDGGDCSVGLESTIVSFATDTPTVLRLGGLPLEAIQACIGKVDVARSSSSNPQAPGMLVSHYAPNKPLYHGDLDKLIAAYASRKFAVIALRDTRGFPGVVLSPAGNLNEAAQHLFAALRQMDSFDCECILAEQVPVTGLGRAINDRLKRASYR